MTVRIAALPMYDWPEARSEIDELWSRIRDRLRAEGVDAPQALLRRNADLPSVPGGIVDDQGGPIAPDPATLPPDDLDLSTLWRHPDLLLGQTCWGPMDLGLEPLVHVVGQPDYSLYEGGEGIDYSSAIVLRRGEVRHPEPPPADGRAIITLENLRGKRFAYNDALSLSGFLGLKADLEAAGSSLAIFSQRIETGAHRWSVRAIAEGKADAATIDCRSWTLCRRFEPASSELAVAGWTARRRGTPFISSRKTSPEELAVLRNVVAQILHPAAASQHTSAG